MSKVTRTAAMALAAAIAFAAVSSASQAATKGSPASLDGVWKVSKVVTTGANAGTVARPQPGIMIFSHGYYSNTAVPGDGPRTASPPAKDPRKPTDAEKLARYEEWNRFIANAGTYEVKGAAITMHPMVAKNVAVMTTEKPTPQGFKLSGDTLVLTAKSGPGEPVSERSVTLTRVR